MNPFENERKEIDEYSLEELEKLYGVDPRADDSDFEEVEPLDDDQYMLFIAGVEPEDVEDKDDDPDDEPIQDPAVCDDGRCGPEYDDDLEVPEWPEWQEEDEIEEISDGEEAVEESTDPFADDYDTPDLKNTYDAEKTKQSVAKDQELLGGKANLDDPFAESLTEDVLNEVNPFKAVGKAVQKGFNKVTGKTGDLLRIFDSFYIVAADLNGGNIRFLDKDGNTSKTAVTFDDLTVAKTTAKNASNTAKCKAIVRGVANKTLNNTDLAGFSNKGDTITAPLYVYVTGKETLDNTPKLINSYANYRKQIGPNGDIDGPEGEGQGQGGGSESDGTGGDGTGGAGAGVTEDLSTKIKNALKAYKPESVEDLITTLKAASNTQATFEQSLAAAGNNVAKVQKAWRDLAAWYTLTTGKKLEKV